MNKSRASSKISGFKAAVIMIFLIFAAASAILLFRMSEAEREREKTKALCATIAEKYSDIYSLDINLVMAVIECESGFDAKAVSRAGACGLMQIMPPTFEWLTGGETLDVFDPEANIKMGCKYLSYLFERFENESTVLAAYNAGEGNVSNWLKDSKYSDDGKTLKAIPFPETSGYVSDVMKKKAEYSKKD